MWRPKILGILGFSQADSLFKWYPNLQSLFIKVPPNIPFSLFRNLDPMDNFLTGVQTAYNKRISAFSTIHHPHRSFHLHFQHLYSHVFRTYIQQLRDSFSHSTTTCIQTTNPDEFYKTSWNSMSPHTLCYRSCSLKFWDPPILFFASASKFWLTFKLFLH